MEVIEFSNDVAFILILPPVEEVCLVPGQNDTMTEKKDLTLLPVQVFEMSKWILECSLFFTMKSIRFFFLHKENCKAIHFFSWTSLRFFFT